MKILEHAFLAHNNSVLVLTDEWPEAISIPLNNMIEAPTLSALGRMAKATIERKKREAAKEAMKPMTLRPTLAAGRHEARNFSVW